MQAGRITIEGGMLRVSCQPHVAIKLQRVFAGSHRVAAGVFTVKATAAAAHELEWFRQRYPLDIEPTCIRDYHNLVAHEERRLATIAEVGREGYEARQFELALPAREYQRIAADLALRTRGLLVADEVGLGKTITAICALTAPGALPAVVVTMTHLPRQWQAQLARFAPTLRSHIIRTGQPYRFDRPWFETDDTGRRHKVAGYVPDVVILNYHKLDGWAEQLAGLAKSIILDEIQELRHEGTNKYIAAKAIAAVCDLRIGLSATPVYNLGDEIWPVLNVVAPNVLGGREEFLREWCTAHGRKHRVRDPAALGTYLRSVGVMIRRTRREVGRELPGLAIVRVPVEVDHGRIHEAVRSVAELATRVLARSGTNLDLMRAAGELDWRLRQATGIGKAAAVVDHVRLLVEAGERVLLAGWHHEVYSLWASAFDQHGVTWARYTGEESDAEKAESVRQFVAGEAMVLMMSLRSGAGLDGLQAVCHTAVIGELDWSPKVHEQFIGRVYRDGQAEPCTAYYMVADQGSDPVIADVLGIKDAQATGIVDPNAAAEPILTGASEDHMKRLATAVLERAGMPLPVPPAPSPVAAASASRTQGELPL
jgi:SNF2 family DNA or RNA helicase